MNALQTDLYYDTHPSSRSPRSSQVHANTVRNQSSRQFDQFGQIPNSVFPQEDHNSRFDGSSRYGDRSGSTLQGPFSGYEMGGGPQGWNGGGYNHNNTLAALGATTRFRPNQRTRGALPDVGRSLLTC